MSKPDINTIRADIESNIRDSQGVQSVTRADVADPMLDTLTFLQHTEATFIDYNHAGNTVSLTADTWTDIPNDGAGAFTNRTYAPEGVTELLDVATGYLDLSELSLGDTVLVRNDFQINPNTNNALIEFRYVLGTGGGEYTLETQEGRLDSGSGKNYRFSLKPDLIYMGDDNTRLNPIKLQVKLSTGGTLTNAGSVIQKV